MKKSAINRDVPGVSLQALHAHVLLVAPLSAGHMAQPGTDQHEDRTAVRETAHYTSTATDIPVEPLDDIVGADTCPVFTGEIAIGQRLFNAFPHLLGSHFQFYGAQLLHYDLGFLPGRFLLSLAWIALSILVTVLSWNEGGQGGIEEHFLRSLQHTKNPVAGHQLNTIQAADTKSLKKADPGGLVLLHALPARDSWT